jgi:hypothetical protein
MKERRLPASLLDIATIIAYNDLKGELPESGLTAHVGSVMGVTATMGSNPSLSATLEER